jgi:hypothetical protein
MQPGRMGVVGAVAGIVLGGLVAVAGCEGAGDDAVSGGNEAELHGGSPYHRRHRGPDAGSVGGSVAGTTGGGTGGITGGATGGGTPGRNGATTADGGTVADCDICTQAQKCCEVVQVENPNCTFSAATCASEVGEARPAYVNACLVYVVSVRGVWAGNPPAECR